MKKVFKNGISIRVIHAVTLVCVVAIAALLAFSTFRSSNVFSTLSSETENYIVRQKAAHELMEASDYLTENVQRFTVSGDVKYLNNYFEEANVSQRRKQAIEIMSENNADQSLIDQLQEALNESNDLMNDEMLAMKIVIDAKEITRYPDALKPVEIDPKELKDKKIENYEFMTVDEKLKLAQEMVMGDEYYASKEIIRTKLNNSLEMMDDQMVATRRKTSADSLKELAANRVIVIILVVVLAALIFLTAALSTIPLITAHRKMKNGERLPMIGSTEFREMSEKYNEMVDQLHPKDAE